MTTLTQTPTTSSGLRSSSETPALARTASTSYEARAPWPSSGLDDEIQSAGLGSSVVAAQAVAMQVSSASDAGVGRTHNEDALLSRPDLGLFAIADGMGGFNAGEVASRLVIETLERRLASMSNDLDRKSLEALVISVVNEANAAVLRTSARRPECLGMGTTLTMLWLTPVGALLAHVGDSRLYQFKNGQAQQLSRDHLMEFIPEVLRERLNEIDGTRKGILTRAIGAESLVEADVQWLPDADPGAYLLCSDGLSDALSLAHIAQHLCQLQPDQKQDVCEFPVTAQGLVDRALDCGATDNVSAILVVMR
jgi:PPM family protein phosphatase